MEFDMWCLQVETSILGAMTSAAAILDLVIPTDKGDKISEYWEGTHRHENVGDFGVRAKGRWHDTCHGTATLQDPHVPVE
ncbi:hypothetical protein J6590_053908, partial [Homalodisca vitripennis]